MVFDEPKPVTEGMKQGLARMYADTYMRDYLRNAVAIAKQNALVMLEQGKFTEAQAYSSRSKSLEQLLDKGKEYFTHFENVARKLKEPLKHIVLKDEVKL
jgi:hypothetical protein